MSHLLFSPDGSLLLHWFHKNKLHWSAADSAQPQSVVALLSEAWDVSSRRLRFHVSGYPIGISSDNTTLITQRGDNLFNAWDAHAGTELPHVQLDASSYPLAQRVYLDKPTHAELQHAPTLADPTRGEWNLIRDIFGINALQWFEISDPLTTLIIGTHVFIACWFDFGEGIEGAYGQAVGLDSGKVEFSFSVNRHAAYVPLYCSVVHQLLFVGGEPTGFNVFDLQTGKKSESASAKAITNLLDKTRTNVEGVAFHPDGEHLALSLKDNNVGLWNIDSAKQVNTLKHLPS